MSVLKDAKPNRKVKIYKKYLQLINYNNYNCFTSVISMIFKFTKIYGIVII